MTQFSERFLGGGPGVKLNHGVALAVERPAATYGDTQVSWVQNSQAPAPIDEKSGVSDYVTPSRPKFKTKGIVEKDKETNASKTYTRQACRAG